MSKLFLFLLVLFECAFTQPKQSLFSPFKQSERLILQPNGKYAVMFFNEDALSVYCAVIYYEAMTNPKDGEWDISKRFWQDPVWSSDVTAVAWSPNGKYLYISTSEVYGDGDLFCLNLQEKTYKRVLPEIKDSVSSGSFATRIEQINEKDNTITVIQESLGDNNSYHKSITIKME